jgi:hypothetical protein
MQPTDSAQERKRKRNHQLSEKYMKRVDTDLARRHSLKTLLVIALIAFLAFLVFAPAEFQIHYLIFHRLIPLLWH